MEIFCAKTGENNEHEAARALLERVLEQKYKILRPQIIVVNKKPVLKTGEIHFSISHSKGLVSVGFSKFPLGLDIEFMENKSPEKLKKFSARYGQEFKSNQEFYKFWTKYEAEIKLQQKALFFKSFEGVRGYMFSIAQTIPVLKPQIISSI